MTRVMMLEIQYLLRQRFFLLPLAVITLFTLWLYQRGTVFVGVLVEGEAVNTPHAIAANAIFFSLLGLAALFPLFNGAALREHRSGFTEVLFSTPIRKADFYFGRFAAGLALCSLLVFLLLACNYLGVKIGLLSGAISQNEVAPFQLSTFLKTYGFYLLPSIFISGSLVFSVAIISRKTIYGLLSVLFLLLFFFLSDTLASNMDNRWLAALADPFGQKGLDMAFQYLDAAERNRTGLSLTPLLLANRLVWGLTGLSFLLVGYARFSREGFQRDTRNGRTPVSKMALPVSQGSQPVVKPTFGIATHWLQFSSLFRPALAGLLTSLPFVILVLAMLGFMATDLSHRYEQYGLQALPLAFEMIEMVGDYKPLLVLALLFFTGELVWKDRDTGMAEIIDATPHSTFGRILANTFAGITALLLAYAFWLATLAGWQLWNNSIVEWKLYTTEIFVYVLPFFFFWLSFFLFLQAVIHHKYAAYALSVAALIGQSFLWRYLDWESNLIRLGKTGAVVISDFNGYQPFLTGNRWLGIYWSLAGGLSIFAALRFWGRGTDSGLSTRFRNGKLQYDAISRRWGVGIVLSYLIVGGFIYFNTHILNSYATSNEKLDRKAEYEKQYRRYAGIEQPNIVDARLYIDLYPEKRMLKTRTELVMKNRSSQAIDSLHFSTRSASNNHHWELEMDIPKSKLVLNDKERGYLIYQLDNPLKPGDSLAVGVRSDYSPRGFENEVSNTDIVPNGSFFNIWEFLPHQGYLPAYELREEKERVKRGLPPERHRGNEAIKRFQNYLYPYAGWIDAATYISTSADQTAIAPGKLEKEWMEDGRRHFHYRLAEPGLFFLSFASGYYEVARRQWKGIELEVYHHPRHGNNVEAMLDAIEMSLDYCIRNFGPYFRPQLRIVEFPRYASFAAAFPGTIPFSEEKGFVLNYEPGRDHHSVLSSVAHEVAHQWWAHQAMPADLPGKQMLTESFAEYTALMVMKQQASPQQMQHFLQYDYDEYLRWRPTVKQEGPLWKADEQPTVYYRKGSVVFYALQEIAGEETVNRALRRYLEAYRFADSPYPSSEDYLVLLKEELPDSLQYLVEELFMESGPIEENLLPWKEREGSERTTTMSED